MFSPADAGIAIEDIDREPLQVGGNIADAPIGPNVEVLHGTVLGGRLELAVQGDIAGICMAIRRGADGSQGCGPLPDAATGPLGIVFSGDAPSDTLEFAGIAGPEVASVSVETIDGRVAEALLVPLDAARVDASAFVVYVSRDIAGPVVVRASDGSELSRLELHDGGG